MRGCRLPQCRWGDVQAVPGLAAKGHNAAGGTLFKRLQWLCDEKQFAPGLRDLAAVVRQDGNDGAHDGTLDKESVEDMAAFADRFLTQLYTEPARVAQAMERRGKRKSAAVEAPVEESPSTS